MRCLVHTYHVFPVHRGRGLQGREKVSGNVPSYQRQETISLSEARRLDLTATWAGLLSGRTPQ